MRVPWLCFCFALFLILNYYSTTAHPSDPTANLSKTWTNTRFLPDYEDILDGSKFRAILFRRSITIPLELGFACGFYCNGNCTSYLFVVVIVQLSFVRAAIMPKTPLPQVVWSANRDHPVSDGAILNFTATGELVLRDADGSMVWTTNTTGKSVAGLNLTDDGNLVLFDDNNSTVWQSFDYATDCLLPGQALHQGQQLIPSISSTNWTTQKDLFSLQVTNNGLFAYVGSNPPQAYFSYVISADKMSTGRRFVRFLNGSLSLFIFSFEPKDTNVVISIPQASSVQYMKLAGDGHLRVFEWNDGGWHLADDLFTGFIEECDYPMACGRNGICWDSQQCSCPVSSSPRKNYFYKTSVEQPALGCSEITPLTCNATQDQVFIEVENVKYFKNLPLADMKSVDMETCKEACANNCSCKAAIYQYDSDTLNGDCFLPSELFTMNNIGPVFALYTFIKVQNAKSTPSYPSLPPSTSGPSKSESKSRLNLRVLLTSTLGSAMFLLAAIGFLVHIIHKRKRATQIEEEYIGEVPGLLTRFSYGELKSATDKFNKKLGEGGFGAVYKGTLDDGSKIAVKCLKGLGQVNKSFLAEVESIGSIHHVNLVRLRGFCAWRSQRFLVYEFMCNGSLDRWIYHRNRENVLEWGCRKKIIIDVAKGLTYLHEDCRQKIIHLDIKPQNILLDGNFNAKVSDFGLSKLINRNQSQVMTTMRGTPGYLAPEWMSSIITEKVDVYSFGIVLLEILCGRKNFDMSQPEESWHLLGVLQKCWEEGMLVDMVDKYSEDMQTHASEVVEMIKIASWCLQSDFKKRPSMSTVVKVLEGVIKVEPSLNYNFTDPRIQKTPVEHEKDMTQLLASVLSGPR